MKYLLNLIKAKIVTNHNSLVKKNLVKGKYDLLLGDGYCKKNFDEKK